MHDSYILVWPESEKYDEDLVKKGHHGNFVDEAENMIKTVKKALANGEGCRVCALLICKSYWYKVVYNRKMVLLDKYCSI